MLAARDRIDRESREDRGRQRPGDPEQGARLDIDRRPQAHFARAGAKRNFQFDAAEIICPAAQRVVDELVAIRLQRLNASRTIRDILNALDSRADTANVEAAEIGSPR